MVKGLVEASARRRELHHLLFHEAGFSEEDAFAPVRAVFLEVLAAGGFGLTDPGLTTHYVLGGVHAAMTAAVPAKPAPRRQLTDQLAQLVIRTLREPPASRWRSRPVMGSVPSCEPG